MNGLSAGLKRQVLKLYNNIIVLSIIISLIFSEITKLSPAGIIVPGYVVLALKTPGRLLYTLSVSFIAFLLLRLLSEFMIIYGRRRFAIAIVLSFLINLGISHFLSGIFAAGIIGTLVPGIIAAEFDRQGIILSLLSLLCVTAAVSAVLLCFGIPVLSL